MLPVDFLALIGDLDALNACAAWTYVASESAFLVVDRLEVRSISSEQMLPKHVADLVRCG